MARPQRAAEEFGDRHDVIIPEQGFVPVGIGTVAGAASSATLLDNDLHAAFGSMIICSIGFCVLLAGGCLRG